MKELLVPVGNMESLVVAVNSGADAVYLGGKRFGARAYANNFDDEEMIKAIKYAHLYGVKIYVTVNTLIYESELDEALDYVTFLHQKGVDAVIMQDIGLISLVRKVLPNLEIHASTQVHNTNIDGLKMLEDLGVKRVVLARELSIDEIDALDTTLEKEVFIHGALCIAYSGQCLFSSMIMNRSGNRGTCAQMCRLPFALMCNDQVLKTEGEYLLSTKELNTARVFKDILDSNVISLKIEGRMKGPEYVGCVTKLYRDLIDKYNQGLELVPDKQILEDLKVIFNREYTKGFINKVSNKELMNIKTPNHLGVHLGTIQEITKKYLKVKLNTNLRQGDGIRFNRSNEGMIANYIFDRNERLIREAKAGEVVLLKNSFDVKIGDRLSKTLDISVVQKYIKPLERKIRISMYFKVLDDKRLSLEISDEVNVIKEIFGLSSSAINAPISEDKVRHQLLKLGGTPFKVEEITVSIPDNIFINIKDINELRRRGLNRLIEVRENVKKDVVINKIDEVVQGKEKIKGISVLCRKEEHIEAALECNVERIYVVDKELYDKYKKHANIYFRTHRVNDHTDEVTRVLATELGAVRRLGGILDYFLNITNHASINYFSTFSDLQTLSVELSFDEVKRIMEYYKGIANLEVVVYSNIELMITKYCPLNMLVNKDNTCKVCKDNNKYYLLDRKRKKFRILNDDNHITHILNYKPLNIIDKVIDYQEIGINNFRIELLDEDKDEAIMLIEKLKGEIYG